MASHLDNIVSLHAALAELEATRASIEGIPDWMTELHEEHSGRLAGIEALEEAVLDARRARRAAEVTIEAATERMKRFQQQINQVTTQREYGALLQEIDTTKGEISAAEEEGLAAMEQREEAEKSLEQERQAFADLDSRYKNELVKWEAEKPALVDRARLLEREIEAVREKVPRPLLAQFDRVNSRHDGNGLAAVQEMSRVGSGQRIYHCSACHYRVRPQVVVEIRSLGSLVLCDSCKRILYYLAAQETE